MPTRIIPQGDVAEAGRWVGVGRHLLADAVRMGLLTLTRQMTPEVTIRVETRPAQKIWITVEDPAWYQFVHTTNQPVVNILSDLPTVWGSGVQLPLPSVIAEKAVAWRTAPIPTGSAVEGDGQTWPVYTGRVLTDQGRLTALQNAVQVQQLPLPVYSAYAADAGTVAKRPWARVLHSQASAPAQMTGAGVASPLSGLGFRDSDVMYDAAPARITGRHAQSSAPDADWYHEAAVYRVSHAQYGTRAFVVMADAQGLLHCWPLGSPKQPISSAYADQQIKTSIAPGFARRVTPPYPDWAYRPDQAFRDQWAADHPQTSPDPRNNWAFHPFEPRVSCIALQRTPAPDRLLLSREAGRIDPATGEQVVEYHEEAHADPFRVRLGDRLAEGKAFESSGEKTEPVSDRPGVVEFDLHIQITGPELTDFAFSASLRHQFLAAGTDYPIAVGYLAPIQGEWGDRGIAASAGDRVELWLIAETDQQTRVLSAAWGGCWFTPMRRVSVCFRTDGRDLLRLRLIEDSITDRVDPSPSGVFDGRWSLDQHESLDGFISDLDIAQMTFVASWQKSRYVRGGVVDQRFATVCAAWTVATERPMAKGSLITQHRETGIRVYHRGKVAIERRYGAEVGLFEAVDTPFALPAALAFESLSVDQTEPLWLYSDANYHTAVDNLLNWTGTCLYAAVALRAICQVVGANTSAVNAAITQESVHDILAQAWSLLADDTLYPPFTHASLARLWSGYTPEWFEATIVPLIDRVWRWARRLLAQVPDPLNQGMTRLTTSLASAGLTAQFPPWTWRVAGWHTPAPTQRYPHLDAWPTGEQMLLTLWQRIVPFHTRMRAVADHRGFLAVWVPMVYAAEPVPAMVEYALFDDTPALVAPEQPADIVPWTLVRAKVVWGEHITRVTSPPPASVIGQAVIDVIRHEHGGETSHRAAYNAAYKRDLQDSDLFGVPSIEIEPTTEQWVYRLQWTVQLDGEPTLLPLDMLGAPDLRSLFSFYTPRANGAALFV